MSRLDAEAGHTLTARLSALRTAIDELKGTPQRLGSDSVLTARVASTAAYDIQIDNVGFNNRVIEVVYTPQITATAGTGLAYRMRFSATYSSSMTELVEELPPENNQQKWRIYLNGSDSSPVTWARYKFYFLANGSGTFTVQLL